MSAPRSKRDCLFYVADKNMEAMLAGFLGRPLAHLSIGCGVFQFDAAQDLRVANGLNDSGIYKAANELLQPYMNSHERVVVILDAAWSGAPTSTEIKQRVEEHCAQAGWAPQNCRAIVIDPELENWVWQDNIHVTNALSASLSYDDLKRQLVAKQLWRTGEPKPHQPKEALEYLLRQNRVPRSSALYKKLAAKVSIQNCSDKAFLDLKLALRDWF